MVTIDIKKVELSEIRLNPNNPRTIKGRAFDNLVKSLRDFPDMLRLREIVVDETMTVLGGNMRLLALRKIGVQDCLSKIVSGLSAEQKREFIIKDNSNFGEFDFDTLANAWDDLPLVEWGVELPADWCAAEAVKTGEDPQNNYAAQYGVIVICESESNQAEVYNKLKGEGFNCRVVNT